jgi:uncharacterized damage-inducible protein DinB
MLEDARRRTRRALEGVNPAAVDWTATEGGHSIGTLLYHIAAIELDWLYSEVLQKTWPPGLEAWFPYDVRNAQGRLTVVRGESLERRWERLDRVRALLLDAYRPMTLEDFRRLRSMPDYDVMPEWVLHHLCQHEAEHRDELAALRAGFEQQTI